MLHDGGLLYNVGSGILLNHYSWKYLLFVINVYRVQIFLVSARVLCSVSCLCVPRRIVIQTGLTDVTHRWSHRKEMTVPLIS